MPNGACLGFMICVCDCVVDQSLQQVRGLRRSRHDGRQRAATRPGRKGREPMHLGGALYMSEQQPPPPPPPDTTLSAPARITGADTTSTREARMPRLMCARRSRRAAFRAPRRTSCSSLTNSRRRTSTSSPARSRTTARRTLATSVRRARARSIITIRRKPRYSPGYRKPRLLEIFAGIFAACAL